MDLMNYIMERLQEQYNKEIVPTLIKKFGYKNVMQVPKIKKIVVNVGVGKLTKDAKFIEAIEHDLKEITGQMPVKTIARKSIAGFKVREGQHVGFTVTLRGYRMYSFLDKLINISLPRVKDFRGIPVKGFDGRGNFNIGLKEHLVFPEISSDALEHIFGIQITLVTDSGKDEPVKELLSQMKFPFRHD